MKTTLLATTGLSPAVVTETIWALAHQTPPIIPNHVEIITTVTGNTNCTRSLHTPLDAWNNKSVWETLRNDLNAKEDELILNINVISIADGKLGKTRELDDIQTPEENAACAEFIFSQVWNVVRDKDQRLIASIAGGRKTMGALLHSAVSLIGRETDILTHILVNSPFDTMPGFFYPKQPGGELLDWSKNAHFPTAAKPILAEVPFVPLRNRFKDLDDLPGSFLSLREELSTRLATDANREVPIIINHQTCTLSVDGNEFTSPNKALVLLHYILINQNTPYVLDTQDTAADDFNTWFPKVKSKVSPIFIDRSDGSPNFTTKEFRSLLSELRKTLKNQVWQPAQRTLTQSPFKLTVIERQPTL